MNKNQSISNTKPVSTKPVFDWQLMILGLVILIFVNINQWQGWTQALDFSLYDNYLRIIPTPADEEIIIVEIDEQSLSLLGNWPWPRSYHGQMIDLLTQADAGVIAYNIVFSNADEFSEDDQSLVRSIKSSGRTIFPLYFDRLIKEEDVTEVLPADVFRQYSGLGHVNSYLDDDGTLRSIRLLDQFLDRQWPHFSFASYLFNQPYASAIDYSLKEVYIPFVTQGDFLRVSFVDVLTGLIDASEFSQRTVFVGVTATSMGDPLLTPVDDDGRQSPAVDINANIYQALKNDQLIQPIFPLLALIINTALILILVYFLPRLSGLQQVLMIIMSFLSLWLMSYMLLKQGYWYRSAGLMFGLVIIPFTWNLLRLSRLFTYFRQQIKQLEQQQVKETFHLPTHTLLKDDSELDALLDLMQIDNYSLLTTETLNQEPILGVVKKFAIKIGLQEKNLFIYFDEFTELEQRKIELLHQLLNVDGGGSSVAQARSDQMDTFAKQLSLIDSFQQQLATSHSLFEASIEGISAGVLVSDLTGKILFSNQALSTLIDGSITELKDLFRCIALAKQDWVSVLREIILLQKSVTLEATANNKDLSVSVRCIDGQQELAPLIVFNITDISVIKQANRSRNEMIDFLSHDLRSPMASLQAMVNQVRVSQDEDQSKEHNQVITEIIDKVDYYSQRGLDFAEQFLALAKVEAIEEIQWYEVDLYSVSQNAVDSLYHQAQEKSIRVVLESIDDCWLLSNGDLLERIVLNLLSNAIKYSPAGSEISLSISSQESTAKKQVFKLEVKDQGPGIPLDLMNSLFEPYQRGLDKNTQQAKGVGLGLRFVDVALKRLNSQIKFDSSSNGTSFYFSLVADR